MTDFDEDGILENKIVDEVFKKMFREGDIAKMKAHAFAVFSVIMVYRLSLMPLTHKTIIEKSGVSLAQVKRSINTLEEMGYITKRKNGGNNIYNWGTKWKIDVMLSVGKLMRQGLQIPKSIYEPMFGPPVTR